MQKQIEEQLGRPIDWEREFESRYREVFGQKLRPVDGIVDVLQGIATPICVASSGTHDKIRFSLSLTGLLSYFEGRIFSVQDVSRGKPAPDLFLHAAQQMGVSPEACAVVEDSPSGVEAALAAGMRAFAFSGGVVPLESLGRSGPCLRRDAAPARPALSGARGNLNTAADVKRPATESWRPSMGQHAQFHAL
jgi:HAD superfamily hydrolase (TIGR01509 family)